MYNFERDMLTSEIRGVLKRIEHVTNDTRHGLSFESMENILDITPILRAMIDRIENRVKEQLAKEKTDALSMVKNFEES